MTAFAALQSLAAAPIEGCDQQLEKLLRLLAGQGFDFVTPTPATHARVIARAGLAEAGDLRAVFGWNLPFHPEDLAADMWDALRGAGGAAECSDGRFRSRYRVSSLRGMLFLHSAFPTDAEDAVFFGPDSYRFAGFVERELARHPPPAGAHLVDVGTGAGVGAIVAGKLHPGLRLTMTDINPKALRLAHINARVAGLGAEFHVGAGLDVVSDPIDLVIANPPYIIDDAGRDYRDGGGMHGAEVASRMAEQAVVRLQPGGRLLLYTGAAIVAGKDALRDTLAHLAVGKDCVLAYEELDPDVFGEELENPAYRDVERIALIGATLVRGG